MTDPDNYPAAHRAAPKHTVKSVTARVLTPAFRRWAYGVSAAAVAGAIFAGWLPEGAAAVLLPLVMAVLYVNPTGQARASAIG
jgi:hypothetical protein